MVQGRSQGYKRSVYLRRNGEQSLFVCSNARPTLLAPFNKYQVAEMTVRFLERNRESYDAALAANSARGIMFLCTLSRNVGSQCCLRNFFYFFSSLNVQPT